MRTFMELYSSDFEGDDDRYPYTFGKSRSSEQLAFTLLSSVCWSWYQTLSGWPQSPTGHWLKHQVRKQIERKCTHTVTQYCIVTTPACYTQCVITRRFTFIFTD